VNKRERFLPSRDDEEAFRVHAMAVLLSDKISIVG